MRVAPSVTDALIDNSGLRCTKCGASMECGCDCWEVCSCGWSAEKGRPCNNPQTVRCSTKARFYGFRPASKSSCGWHSGVDAAEDGRLCALRFTDSSGAFESGGPFFLHEGHWYLFEPPMQLDLQPTMFKPL